MFDYEIKLNNIYTFDKIYADYISLFIFERSISLDLRIVFECHFSSCFSLFFTITLLKINM